MKRELTPAVAHRSFKAWLYEKGLSDSTVVHYHNYTLEFITWLDQQSIETEQVQSTDVTAYLHHLKAKGQANITRSIRLNVIKHFFDYLVGNSKRKTNPATHIKIRGTRSKKLYPLLSLQELEQLYHAYTLPGDQDEQANRNWFTHYKLSRQRNKAILGLMIWQGLTTAEINKLTLADINLREGKISIAGSRKSAARILELKPQQVIILLEYTMQVRPQLEKLLGKETQLYFLPVPAAGKQALTDNNTVNIWKRLSQEMNKINSRFINFKQVRSSVIIHWLKQYNLRQVQYMAGHKYVSTTEAYLSGQVEDLQADIEQYHPIG